MKKGKESFFWTSYSDLMTSLFFVMLVLFVLIIVVMRINARATELKYQQAKEVVNSVKELDRHTFAFDSINKRFSLRMQVKFAPQQFYVATLPPREQARLIKVGRELRAFLRSHSNNKYLIVVEGQASRDNYADNYGLSYKRALNLVKVWMLNGITFDGSNGELLIAGSGDGRMPTNSSRLGNEAGNQRFLIHIIPKNVFDN